MSVKIRLTRMGKKKQPTYRVVVMDSRKPRDGAYLEQIGRYDPRQEPSIVEIDNERAMDWLMKGAQPTERARKLLEISGAWMQFRVAKGDVHTVGEAEETAAPEAEAPAPAAPEHTPEVHVVGDPLPEDGPAAAGDDSSPESAPSVEDAAASEDEASPQPEDTNDAAAEATADDKEES